MEEQIKSILTEPAMAKVVLTQYNGDKYVVNYNKFDVDEFEIIEKFVSLMDKYNILINHENFKPEIK